MAVASSTQSGTTVQQLTPPSSSHGERGAWGFAVPLNNTKTSYTDHKPFMSGDDPSVQLHPASQPLSAQSNGVHRGPHAHTLESQRQYPEDDQGYLVPNHVNELRSKGSDITANGSDPDSALEYYKGPEGKNGLRNASHGPVNKEKRKKGKGAGWTQAEEDEANWIHRDKLKEIESRELEEAGFRVGRTSRSNSKSQSAARPSRDQKHTEASDQSPPDGDRHEQRRMVSPIPAEYEEGDDDPPQWDLRTPEEIADEQELWSAARTNHHVIRPSTSRIPVAKTSFVPVPHTFVERDTPLPRSRGGSANWSGDAIAVNGARVRSGSISSQVLLDEPRVSEDLLRTPLQNTFGSSNPTSPTTGSPPKAKVPGKGGPTSGGRKASSTQRITSTAKSRNVSATSPSKRPGTSGGSVSRPTTSHRPEGEAPWIATMYKPDPRLPPDQQIIPTHAKRMKQDQWETEGKTGSMYDTDFRLLNTEEFKDKRSSRIQPLDLERKQDMDDPQWPLPSPTKAEPENAKSPTSEQPGYKLTPTIPQSPRVTSPQFGSRQPSSTSPKATNTTRLPEPTATEEKEKKGCCCIVM